MICGEDEVELVLEFWTVVGSSNFVELGINSFGAIYRPGAETFLVARLGAKPGPTGKLPYCFCLTLPGNRRINNDLVKFVSLLCVQFVCRFFIAFFTPFINNFFAILEPFAGELVNHLNFDP